MIIRIFVVLLALNLVAFVVRAEADELVFDDRAEASTVEQVLGAQERLTGNPDDSSIGVFSELGSRLLTWTFSRTDSGKRFASEPAQPDHGLALLNEGACLNLKWNF
ncbi:hypothetical protein LPB19_07810 [Marinobacter salinisoli]|uniref:Uncharacterized protein n=1 Tax=Marinobacter salinisoli TaxID=2769486 RepID=A0ABX7MVG6_9GAMM|nr:hypothetical protein [Marinobacter salinisoli]QSP96271.1 hypothetical protein LPB19_07810 [Marinobacter salinisoli]